MICNNPNTHRREHPTMNCQVFALCTNEATTTYDAGPLGDVPACQRCADKMERIANLDNKTK